MKKAVGNYKKPSRFIQISLHLLAILYETNHWMVPHLKIHFDGIIRAIYGA